MKPQPFALERFFAAHEFRAPHLLCASDCESWSVREILGLEPDATERFLSLRLGYTDSAGDPALRAEIARGYASIRPEEVLVFAGAEEAIFAFMSVALSPGDRV